MATLLLWPDKGNKHSMQTTHCKGTPTTHARTAATLLTCCLATLLKLPAAGSFLESRLLELPDSHVMCTSLAVCGFRGLPHFRHSWDVAVSDEASSCRESAYCAVTVTSTKAT